MQIGSADIIPTSGSKSPPGVRDAISRADAWKEAANRLANLHPHEWAVLYAAALKERGLTD
jgi:hypothetical protein